MVTYILRRAGVALIAVGILVILFALYLIYGTGIFTKIHQRSLSMTFQKEQYSAQHRKSPAGSPPLRLAPAIATQIGAVETGQAIGTISIPAMHLKMVVVQGTSTTDLELGPGHYLGTPMPGQPGNVAIAGHRTTYLHPFYSLTLLRRGDRISITTVQGHFIYSVTGSKSVSPTDLSVLSPTFGSTLTLTTCNPRYSAATRLVVTATLESPSAAVAKTTTGSINSNDHKTLTQNHRGDPWWVAFLLGLGILGIVSSVWWVRKRMLHPSVAYIVAGALLLVLLFYFFAALSQLLPTGY